MRSFIALLCAGVILSTVNAACDNQCSGHGTCLSNDVCQCYDNWGVGLSFDSGDCSDRICPFELAWVDTPNQFGEFHKYAECAGKGICDRATAECTCFDGYEGKACQRTSCPNDCSGHGTCEYIEDMGYGQLGVITVMTIIITILTMLLFFSMMMKEIIIQIKILVIYIMRI